jgi:hypothetical protein
MGLTVSGLEELCEEEKFGSLGRSSGCPEVYNCDYLEGQNGNYGEFGSQGS